MQTYLLIISTLLSLPLVGCNSAPINPETEEQSEKAAIEIRGKIIFVDLEGGFWGLITEDGKPYRLVLAASQPAPLPGPVLITGTVRENQPSIHQWGDKLEIVSIQQLPRP